ncbi:hypothetical protein EDC96DRAFT_561160 [Choanephora cucurbitarum]|nr:hypothetical protein EDC96DRAFT_561160 [Choanephora cucurbitarum]
MPASKFFPSILNTSELSKSNEPILSPTLPPSPIQTVSSNVIRIQMISPEEEKEEEDNEYIDDGLPKSIPTPPTFSCQHPDFDSNYQKEADVPTTRYSHIPQDSVDVSSKVIAEPIIKHAENKRGIIEIVQTDQAKDMEIEQISQVPIISTVLFPLAEETEIDLPTPAASNNDPHNQPHPDFKMKSTFTKTSFYYRLKQKVKIAVVKLFNEKPKAIKPNESRQMISTECILSETKEPTPNNDQHLSRSISAIAIAGKDSDIEEQEVESEDDEEQEKASIQTKQPEVKIQLEGPPIYCRNIATSVLYNLSKTEPVATCYSSPQLGSGDAYDIKVLCEQSFFGHS